MQCHAESVAIIAQHHLLIRTLVKLHAHPIQTRVEHVLVMSLGRGVRLPTVETYTSIHVAHNKGQGIA